MAAWCRQSTITMALVFLSRSILPARLAVLEKVVGPLSGWRTLSCSSWLLGIVAYTLC